jgi:hypothetical protein
MDFVDLCERAAREGGDLEQTCREVQQAEWAALFGWCWQQTGRP